MRWIPIPIIVAAVLAGRGDGQPPVGARAQDASTPSVTFVPDEALGDLRPVGEEWVPIVTDSSAEASWTLWQTAGSEGSRCFSLDLAPAIETASTTSTVDDRGLGAAVQEEIRRKKTYKGRLAECVAAPTLDITGDPLRVVLLAQGPDQHYHILVGWLAEDIEQVRLSFEDGPDDQAEVKERGFVIRTWPSSIRLQAVRLTSHKGVFRCEVQRIEEGGRVLAESMIPGCTL